MEFTMLVIKNKPPSSNKTEAKSGQAAGIDSTGAVPTYDPFSDEELWRRVGEVIAKAGRPPMWPKK
jgi:hypothetical protein